MDREPEITDFLALLERVLGPERQQEALPTTGLGRIRRLGGSMARTGAALGWKRLRGGPAGLDEALAEELVRTFGTLKGVAMKVGQILSYTDESLPPEVRRVLATLQTHSPHLPFERIARIVREELGEERGRLLASRMDPRPAAAASIGQVHRATLPDGHGAAVAVKVQYPGIAEAIEAEFRAGATGVRFARLVMPGRGFREYVEEARDRVLEECDYERELAWQHRFRGLYRDHPVIRVPEAYPKFSSRRVLTSAWMEGERFDAWLEGGPPQPARNRVGEALYEFYVGTLLRHGIFNADPHPGNYLVAEGDRLAMLDYGCVRAFSDTEVQGLVALAEAVRRDEPAGISQALRDVGASPPPGHRTVPERTRALLRAFFSPTLTDRVQRVEPPGGSGMGELLSDKRALAELELPGRFLFLFRIRFGLHAVLARLGAEANWYRLERRWIGEGGGQKGS